MFGVSNNLPQCPNAQRPSPLVRILIHDREGPVARFSPRWSDSPCPGKEGSLIKLGEIEEGGGEGGRKRGERESDVH